jgi:hypothetical protein
MGGGAVSGFSAVALLCASGMCARLLVVWFTPLPTIFSLPALCSQPPPPPRIFLRRSMPPPPPRLLCLSCRCLRWPHPGPRPPRGGIPRHRPAGRRAVRGQAAAAVKAGAAGRASAPRPQLRRGRDAGRRRRWRRGCPQSRPARSGGAPRRCRRQVHDRHNLAAAAGIRVAGQLEW